MSLQNDSAEHVLITEPRSPRDWAQYSEVAHDAFSGEYRDLAKHQENDSAALLGVIDDSVVGGAVALRAHQFFGGEPVETACLADVCLRPEVRGRKLARLFLDGLMRKLREEGAAISTLWTPTPGLYRGLGWEVSGVGQRWSLPIRALQAIPPGGGEIVPGVSAAARHLQLEIAQLWDGPLRRPDWWWDWKYPSGSQNRIYTQVVDGQPNGILGYRTRSIESWGFDIVVSDFWARDVSASRGLLSFLTTIGTMAENVHFETGTLPALPTLLWDFPRHELQLRGWYPWMLRLIDPIAALQRRGWPASVEGVVEFEIVDPSPMRLTLEVSNGKACVATGGSGEIRMTQGQMAAWFSGSLTYPALKTLLATSKDQTLDLMSRLTHRTETWLPDPF